MERHDQNSVIWGADGDIRHAHLQLNFASRFQRFLVQKQPVESWA